MTTLPEEAVKAAAIADQLEERTKLKYASPDGEECQIVPLVLLIEAAAAIRSLSSQDHADAGKVEGNGNRWRIFEAACARGYWGIELEQASNDDEPILYPIKVHRDTLVRIVEAHNFPLPSAPSQEVAGS